MSIKEITEEISSWQPSADNYSKLEDLLKLVYEKMYEFWPTNYDYEEIFLQLKELYIGRQENEDYQLYLKHNNLI